MINFFKALADETRLRVLNLLIDNELNVNEIMSVLSMGQSRISRHLKILTDCNLLKFRRDGLGFFIKQLKQEKDSILFRLSGLLLKMMKLLPGIYLK